MADDPHVVRTLIEQSRDAAWGDVEANLQRRLHVEGMRPDLDPDYDRMRAARMQSIRLVDLPRLAAHRRHMIRSVTLALSTITNRFWTPILFIALQPLQHSIFGGNEEHYLWLVAGLGAWLGWTVPFACVQWWLSRKRALARSSISGATATRPV